jgi:hypothetical protein
MCISSHDIQNQDIVQNNKEYENRTSMHII